MNTHPNSRSKNSNMKSASKKHDSGDDSDWSSDDSENEEPHRFSSDKEKKLEVLRFPLEKSVRMSQVLQEILSLTKKKFVTQFEKIFKYRSKLSNDIREKLAELDMDDLDREELAIADETARLFVIKVNKWIEFIDTYVFTPKGDHPLKALNFLHCVVVDKRGTIDYAETARKLLAEWKLSCEDKLKIASIHCLQDEIMKITEGKNFPAELSPKTYQPTSRLVEFWKKFILSDEYSEDIEKLIKIVGHGNENGIMFFWDKLTETQKDNVIEEIFRHADVEFQVEWLDGKTKEEQEYVMKKCGGHVLMNLMNSPQWYTYFYTTAIFARDVLSNEQYGDVISKASAGASSSIEYDEVYDEHVEMLNFMWKHAPQRVKQYVYEQDSTKDLFWYLRYNDNYEFFQEFFDEAPPQFKRKFLEGESGMAILKQIASDIFQFHGQMFDELIKSAYPEDRDADEFKMKYYNSEEMHGNLRCFVTDDENTLNRIINGIFATAEAAIEFKKRFFYHPNGHRYFEDDVSSVFFTDDRREKIRSKIQLNKVTKSIGQYLSTEEAEIFKKTMLCERPCVKSVFLDVMKTGRFQLIDAFLKWSIDDDQAIVEYKKNLYSEALNNEFAALVSSLVMKKDNFETLSRFDSWCSMSEENHRRMCDAVLSSAESMMPAWRYMLFEERFVMADNFLKWCGRINEEEKKNAKNQLFLDIDWNYLMFGDEVDDEKKRAWGKSEAKRMLEQKMQIIYEWFSPTLDMRRELAEREAARREATQRMAEQAAQQMGEQVAQQIAAAMQPQMSCAVA